MNKILLIDGHSILNRAFYGVPDLTNKSGLHTNAVYGFLNILFKAIEDEKPTHLAVAFDLSAPTFRHEMYKEYKGTRHPMPDELREQVPVMKELLSAMNVTIMEQAGYEADDILGTMAKNAQGAGFDAVILSGDRDLLQIADEHIKIRIPKTKGGKTEVEEYFPKDVIEKYSVTPLQFIDVKALMGDSSDNIPGVPKVGEKTAISLIVKFDSIDGIYEHIEEVPKPAIKQSLIDNKDLAYFCQKLVTIEIHADIPYRIDDTVMPDFYNDKSYGIIRDLELKSYLTKFDSSMVKVEKKAEVSILKGDEKVAEGIGNILNHANEQKPFVAVQFLIEPEKEYIHENTIEEGQLSLFDLAPNSDSSACKNSDCDNSDNHSGVSRQDEPISHRGHILAASISAGSETVSFEIKNEKSERLVICALSDFITKDGGMISVCGVKPYYGIFENITNEMCAKDIGRMFFDGIIAAYLLNPLKNDYDAESVIEQFDHPDFKNYLSLFGKENPKDILKDPSKKEEYLEYQGQIAAGIYNSTSSLKEKLSEQNMTDLFENIEMPVSLCLYEMERDGVRVLRNELIDYSKSLEGRIDALSKEIIAEAGVDFNINSPKQLGEILFEKMQIPGGKKTKTGYSTSADVLEKLAPDHPIVARILEYRALSKLKSTYGDGLLPQIKDDERIHTTFQQTVTATGRLSSTDPNLQNIPIRTEEGRLIRKVFVPLDNCIFMDADYSQIELRLLAHMSEDAQLIEAYNSGEDIHAITASKVFNVPVNEVDSLLRRRAKAVNFGIVYGISSFGLSQDLNLSRKEAEQYIEQYFITYPGIKGFLDGAVKSAKENGYSLTLYGRRRPIPELKSSNFMQRSFGERVAMNAPIQGTAADIMKIAMIHVRDRLFEEGLKSRILIQVHDELLLEVPKAEEEKAREILKSEMEKAANLAVRLEVDLHTGDTWYDAK